MKLKKIVEVECPVGMYAVVFDTVWGSRCTEECTAEPLNHPCMDNEPDYIAEVDAKIVKVTLKNALGFQGLDIDSNTTESYDDTHDFRTRIFKTRREARGFVMYTMNNWKHPAPWQCFVKV